MKLFPLINVLLLSSVGGEWRGSGDIANVLIPAGGERAGQRIVGSDRWSNTLFTFSASSLSGGNIIQHLALITLLSNKCLEILFFKLA